MASSVVGLRQVIFESLISAVVVFSVDSPATFAGGEVATVIVGPGIPPSAAKSPNVIIRIPFPEFALQEGESIRVRDLNNVDPSGDIIRMRISHETYVDAGV